MIFKQGKLLTRSIALSSLAYISFCSITFAQTPVKSPTVAHLQQNELAAGALDSTVTTTKSLQTTIAADETEAWVPLGLFKYAGIYRVTVSSAGNSAHSSAICEFSLSWGGVIQVHRISSHRVQGRFDFYSTRGGGETGVPISQSRYLMLKYTKVATGSTNRLNVTIEMDSPERWSNSTIANFEAIGDGHKLVPVIGNEWTYNSGGTGYRGVRITKPLWVTDALYLNSSPVLTEASATSQGYIRQNGTNLVVGQNASAVGNGAFAFGTSATAASPFSMASGHFSHATATASVANGYGASAVGFGSVASGFESRAAGEHSVALGYHSNAFGKGSLAAGWEARTEGAYSTAFGKDTLAYGAYSTALGYKTETVLDYSIAAGRYNEPGSNIFSIGNGTAQERSNVFEIDVSGITTFSNSVNIEKGEINLNGDIQGVDKSRLIFGNGNRTTVAGTFENFGLIIGNDNTAKGAKNDGSIGVNMLGSNLENARENSLIIGTYNLDDPQNIFAIGNGSEIERSNAFEVKGDGDALVGGDLSVKGSTFMSGAQVVNLELYKTSDSAKQNTFSSGAEIASYFGTDKIIGNHVSSKASLYPDAGDIIGSYAASGGKLFSDGGNVEYSTATSGGVALNTKYSMAASGGNLVDSSYATSFGGADVQTANYAIASGKGVIARSNNSSVFGANNNTSSTQSDTSFAANSDQWTPTDELFVIGNGPSGTSKSNALTILKNGNVGIGNTKLQPEKALEVGGDAEITGSLIVNDSQVVTRANLGFYLPESHTTHDLGNLTKNWGNSTVANGFATTAWGEDTRATHSYSTAFGDSTLAGALNATAFGFNTRATTANSLAIGEYNDDTTGALFSIGNGDSLNRSNAFEVDEDGNVNAAGALVLGTSVLTPGSTGFVGGANSKVDGENSFAFGARARVKGDSSVVLGQSIINQKYEGWRTYVTGDELPVSNAFASGYSIIRNQNFSNDSAADHTTAMGRSYVAATGYTVGRSSSVSYSSAIGRSRVQGNHSDANYATAIGESTIDADNGSNVDRSSALGRGIIDVKHGSNAEYSAALGRSKILVGAGGDAYASAAIQGEVDVQGSGGSARYSAALAGGVVTSRGASSKADHSLAVGQSRVMGNHSIALGQNNNISVNNTSGVNNAVAIGHHLNAEHPKAVILGQFNKPTEQELFVVGNGDGNGPTARLNAITTLKNGQTTISHREYDVAASPAEQPESLVVNGGLTVDGVIRVKKSYGDISMGIYGNQ